MGGNAGTGDTPVSPLLVWEGPADEMPSFCPQGCGGPCQASWNASPPRMRTL